MLENAVSATGHKSTNRWIGALVQLSSAVVIFRQTPSIHQSIRPTQAATISNSSTTREIPASVAATARE